MIIRLTKASLRFRNRAQTLRQWPRAGGSSLTVEIVVGVVDVIYLLQPYSRIDNRVSDVDYKIR